ncbi:hypothetical protein J8L98_20120 [Pseudoalteromonas sp. MMG013]|uniref:hypothetical protein n=1 Tax=unclassified Pseudoalteromonas TaxID=194690 RepID=UPI001B383569|nr:MULTISPECIES: hypothetical protein [unclassified Pseudoalteromonas]MBQ4845367.1 hypothetical protein [Pseudoalteromonas sp. MMG005]MBQ4849291.1 hypothetical protein [Pseudoalteromonas sp. MMG012]MBQ4863998.1 hypothetical protein [Pseudoalteromonas sp. MMG013]
MNWYVIAFSFFMSAQVYAKCVSEAYRHFDFWVGDWQVKTPDGKIAGRNVITIDYEGCVIKERYKGLSGYRGESVSLYDVTRNFWHQTWVDNTGLLLQLGGGLQGNKMVLTGTSFDREGNLLDERITWTPNADGTVRQVWRTRSQDQKWQTIFDGLYIKKK